MPAEALGESRSKGRHNDRLAFGNEVGSCLLARSIYEVTYVLGLHVWKRMSVDTDHPLILW